MDGSPIRMTAIRRWLKCMFFTLVERIVHVEAIVPVTAKRDKTLGRVNGRSVCHEFMVFVLDVFRKTV